MVIAAALILRLALMGCEGYTTDIDCFKAWATHAAKSLSNFYLGELFTDYPPGYIYVLWLVGKIKDLFSLPMDSISFLYLIKMPAVLADLISVYFIYWIASRKINPRVALGLAMVYAVNPAVVINSAIWGQVDAIFTLILLVSLYGIYRDRLRLGTVWYVMAVLFKPQALLLAPLNLYIFMDKRSWRYFWQSVLIGLGVFVLLVLPFSMKQHPLWIIEQYLDTLGSYPYASLNAWNLFALFGGNWAPINEKFMFLTYEVWGYVFLTGAIIASAIIYIKRKDKEKIFYIAAFMYLAFFVTGIKTHERYMFPVLLFTLISYIYTQRKAYYYFFLVLSTTHFINVAYVLYMGSHMDGVMYVISVAHVVWLIGFYMTICQKKWSRINGIMLKPIKQIKSKRQIESRKQVELRKQIELRNQIELTKQQKMTVKDWIIMLGILFLYGCIAFFNLGDKTAPQTFYRADDDMGAFYIDFGEVEHIDSMTSYTGADIGGKLHISLSVDGNDWTEVGYMEHNNVFLWNKLTIDKAARYVRCMPKGICEIGEVSFFEKSSTEPINIHQIVAKEQYNQEEVLKAVDEQQIAVAIPSYKNSSYFDEIYFARTGYEYLNNRDLYEYTHPPLGKLMISIGIAIFDMTPFGWRFSGTVIGILMVGSLYVMGKRLFGQTKYAVLAASILALDGMHFVQTRIATVDGFLVFFVILMYYFMYMYVEQLKDSKTVIQTLKPLFFSGLFFALGVATKWSVLYGGIGLGVIYFYGLIKKYLHAAKVKDKKRNVFIMQSILGACGCFVILPVSIYLLSYVPGLLIDGGRINSLSDVINLQKDMFLYHKQLVSDHPFASKPWTWPLLIKPVWYYMGRYGLAEGTRSSIVLIGNPVIWWSGIIAVCYTFYHTVITKNKVGIFLLTAFFVQYLPYFLIPRQMFLYHYFPSLIFLMLMIVHALNQLEKQWGYKKINHVMVAYGVMVFFTFVLFYPILSGSIVTRAFAEAYLRWIDTWIFI